jgi:periplasmic protein TonB
MFEDSTFESNGTIHTRSRSWVIATFALNASILVALILIPLFYPEALSGRAISILMTAPSVPVEQPRPVARPAQAQAAPSQANNPFQAPRQIPIVIYVPDQPEPSALIDTSSLASGAPGPGSSDSIFHGTNLQPTVVRDHVGPKQISSGVAVGMLIRKVVPDYPVIGRNMRVEGTVVLQAMISKSGTIENLRVVSGPALLQRAAMDAVKQWQYRPYLLNGEPVEVETTVNVDFKLN